MYYEDVFRELNKARVRYLVIGGVAVNLHGVPRMTADLDLMVDVTDANLARLVGIFDRLGYKPRAPVQALNLADAQKRKEWVEEKHMSAFTFWNPSVPYEEVDILLENPIDFEEAYGARKIVRATDLRIPLASIEHLIILKRETGRGQDLSDVDSLEKLKRVLEERR